MGGMYFLGFVVLLMWLMPRATGRWLAEVMSSYEAERKKLATPSESSGQGEK